MTVHWKHDDVPTVCPALPGGAKLIEFMTTVFDARVQALYPMGESGVAHAEIRVGDSIVMTGDPMGDHALSPAAVSIYVPDCDAAHERALKAGATSREAPSDRMWGDRSCRIVGPCGNTWSIATRIEEVSQAEIEARMAKMGA